MAQLYTNCPPNCPTGTCPTCSPGTGTSTTTSGEFTIKQGDTCPTFEFQVKDPLTGLPISFLGWTAHVYMFFYSYLKSLTDIGYSGYSGYDPTHATLKLTGNQNFCQIKIGDIIGVEDCDQNRQEFLRIVSMDYDTYEITIERGYGNSDIYNHKKGDKLIIYRIYGNDGYITSKNSTNIESNVDEAGVDTDGTDTPDYSVIGYQWCVGDTSHKGKYLIDFKVSAPPIDGYSGTYDCGVRIKSFPNDKDGYIVNII